MRTIRGTAHLALLLTVVAGSVACSNRGEDIKVCVMYPKDLQAAIDACTRLIDSPPPLDSGRHGWFASRGNHRIKARDFKGAVADLDEAIRLMPNDAQLYEIRAEAHRLNGNSAAAARDELRAQEMAKAERRNP